MSTIDLRTLPVTTPSLFIPRVFPNIDEKRIRRIFDELAIGVIERVDIVPINSSPSCAKLGDSFNRVYVHFNNWLSNTDANKTREALLSGKEIKIVYDEPWFWKVSAYREQVRVPKPVRQEKKKATIQFDEEEPVKHPIQSVTKQQPQPAAAIVNRRLVPRQLQPNNTQKKRVLKIEEEKSQQQQAAKPERANLTATEEEGEVFENK